MTLSKRTLRAAWLSTRDEEFRSCLEGVWVSLATFQAGVGAHPVSGNVEGLNIKDALVKLEAYGRWGPLVMAESKALAADIELFKLTTSYRPGA